MRLRASKESPPMNAVVLAQYSKHDSLSVIEKASHINVISVVEQRRVGGGGGLKKCYIILRVVLENVI
jgi:hypothetical protein